MIPLCFPKISMNLWVHLQFSLHPLWSHGFRPRKKKYYFAMRLLLHVF
ncbi:MAG: hypothetical protein P8X79_09290 [Reinekea sp.]